ncbi:MAG: glycine zipper family protein [Proteobacteria bacterium]|nr:glycine zipper family protein [Pseudomonadota bacterium]MDA0992678.1 glycine zipper family protein [Pseudomonadota bacterium]
MKPGILSIIALATLVPIGGCASHPDPIIDMKGVDKSTMQADWGECEAYSDQVVLGKGAAKGAAGGAVVGAATGAISGDAEAGAGYGAIWGATRSTLEGDREKQMVFKRCMRGRGYRVLN